MSENISTCLHRLVTIKSFLCLFDVRIGVAILSAIGIVLDIHMLNAAISLLMICALGVKSDNEMLFCSDVWFIGVGGALSFITGVCYLAIALPILAVDALHLLGFIKTIPKQLFVAIKCCVSFLVIRLIYVIAAVAMFQYVVFGTHLVGLTIGVYWLLCSHAVTHQVQNRQSTDVIL